MWRPRRLSGTPPALEQASSIELLTSCALVALGFISYKQLATPACNGLPHSLSVDSSVLAAYPCDGSLLRTQLYILLNTSGVFWDICCLKHEDAWVTLSFLGLFLRLLACLVLPPRLYNKVLVPVLVYFIRALLPTFHVLMGPAFRPSPLALRSLFGTFTAFDVCYFFSMLGLWRVNPTLKVIYCAWSTLSLMLLCHWYGNLVPRGVRPAWQLGARLGVAATTLSAEWALRRWRRGGAAAAGGGGGAAATKIRRVKGDGEGEGEAEGKGVKEDGGGGEGSRSNAVAFASRYHRSGWRRDGCLPYVRWQPEQLPAEVWPYDGFYGSRPASGTQVGADAGAAALPAEVMAALGGAAVGPAGPAPAVAAYPMARTTPLVGEARTPATTPVGEAAAATRGSTEVPRPASLARDEDAEGTAAVLGAGLTAPILTDGSEVWVAAPIIATAASAAAATSPAPSEATITGATPVGVPAESAAAAESAAEESAAAESAAAESAAAAAADATPALTAQPPSCPGGEVDCVAAGHLAVEAAVGDAPPAEGPAALPPYRSIVKRRTVVVKIPWAEPEQLPADFLQQLRAPIAGWSRPARPGQGQVPGEEVQQQTRTGGWLLAHAYVRRGCIELMLGLVAVEAPEPESESGSAARPQAAA